MMKPVIFFDTSCMLCNRSIQLLLFLDRKNRFLLSDFSSTFFNNAIKPDLTETESDTVILFYNNSIFTKSDAIFEIFRILGGFYKVLLAFKILPKRLRNRFYDFIAENRHKWFGKTKTCLIPHEKLIKRFLS